MTDKKNGAPLGVPDAEAARKLLSQKYRVPTIDLEKYEIDEGVIRLIPREVCERHVVIPVSQISGSLVVAMSDPNDKATLDALTSLTGLKIEPVVATAAQISTAIAKYYAINISHG